MIQPKILKDGEVMEEEFEGICDKLDQKEDRLEMVKVVVSLLDNQMFLKKKMEEMISQNNKMYKKNVATIQAIPVPIDRRQERNKHHLDSSPLLLVQSC